MPFESQAQRRKFAQLSPALRVTLSAFGVSIRAEKKLPVTGQSKAERVSYHTENSRQMTFSPAASYLDPPSGAKADQSRSAPALTSLAVHRRSSCTAIEPAEWTQAIATR
jgi:hypothetical protein